MHLNLFLLPILFTLCSFTNETDEKKMNNPFFKEWKTPFKTPPFNEIMLEHYLPAIEEGINQQKSEVEAIINNKEKSTFHNTIDALESSGQLLVKVRSIFNNLNAANTNDEMLKLSKTISPILTKHKDDINLNEKLFDRIKRIYSDRNTLQLTSEQKKVIENFYSDFVRGGANLKNEQKEKFRKINEELAMLSLKFSENILKETNAIGLVIDSKEDLIGLPDAVIQGAFETAKEKGLHGKWAFTLQRPSWIPFLQYSEKRNLREKLFKAYINRGNNNNEFDTKKILSRIVSLRVERAKLLGFKTHADFVLDRNMAKKPEKVFKFLHDVWKPALQCAKREADEMQKIIDREENKFKLQPWDWWYYAEKVKKQKYDLDEEMLRPYFKLENVQNGMFTVASKLYDIQFIERKDIPVYHPDVKVFEVKETKGKHIGILYTDYYPRESKRSGAWMDDFRSQSNINAKYITPVIYNVGNFTKPTKDNPALLSLDDVNTMFHEFGHALHGLLSDITYPSVSGTNVPRDFVELPSQFMENWATHPEVLRMYAQHYETGEPMPKELIDKIAKSSRFNQGFVTVEYIAASFLDMDWHTLTDAKERNATKFENDALKKIGLIHQIESRYQSTNFLHIFSSDYSAGYYSYLWAAVLDADAFDAFLERSSGNEKSIFNKEVATSFRKNILSKGGSDNPMALYVKFRGREPKVDALLKKRGLD